MEILKQNDYEPLIIARYFDVNNKLICYLLNPVAVFIDDENFEKELINHLKTILEKKRNIKIDKIYVDYIKIPDHIAIEIEKYLKDRDIKIPFKKILKAVIILYKNDYDKDYIEEASKIYPEENISIPKESILQIEEMIKKKIIGSYLSDKYH